MLLKKLRSEFVLKTKYQTDKTELENKVPDVTNLVKKTKLTKLENRIPDVSALATRSTLTAVENKISDVSSLIKKTNCDTKLVNLRRNLLTIIMANILPLQSLIL